MDLLAELREYGFSEKEAKVYLALCSLGLVTVNDIAEQTNLIRTTTYDILKLLGEKGFVASTKINKILYFETQNPKQLASMLDEKKKKINKIIPTLAKLREQLSPKPTVELFKGKEGMKTAFREILRIKQPIYAYSNNKEMVKILPFFSRHFINGRVKAGIPIKIFSEESTITKHLLQEKDKKELRETKIFSKLKKISINQYIFGDTIAIFGSKKDTPIGIIIKHREYAELQKTIFEELWNKAKK